ncbi:MAG: nucleotide disphospho-sugar-binding domain-containing protein [Acidimicrobiales bacterium]
MLAHGLASVALPQSADNFTIAGLLAQAGAAHTLMPGEVTGPAVRSGLRAVLNTVGYRRRAQQLADEIAAMPSPEEVAARLRTKVEGPVSSRRGPRPDAEAPVGTIDEIGPGA